MFVLVLIFGFLMLVQGCGSDPDFWYALSDSFTGGSSGGSSSDSYSGSRSDSSSYNTYEITLYNDSNVTITVYGDGYKYIIPPKSNKKHTSRNMFIDWDYEPGYLKAYTGPGSVRFNE